MNRYLFNYSFFFIAHLKKKRAFLYKSFYSAYAQKYINTNNTKWKLGKYFRFSNINSVKYNQYKKELLLNIKR